MKLYKLTKQDGTTHNGFPYAVRGDEEHCLPEVANPRTCSSNVLHAYKSIELAFLLNPIHARIQDPRLWEIEGDVVVEQWDKVGSFKQKIVRELPIPSWVRDNKVRVRFAKMCADAARAAAYAAYAAAADADAAAADSARIAADADARAAADADTAAYAAYAATTAYAATAYAATAAAAAARASAAYASAGITINIQKIAELAIK